MFKGGEKIRKDVLKAGKDVQRKLLLEKLRLEFQSSFSSDCSPQERSLIKESSD